MSINKELKNEFDIFISRLVPWINEKINESNGIIITRIEDIKKEIGPKFENISNRELYWSLKLMLYNEGIITNKGKITNKENITYGDAVIIFRIATPGDTLPIDFSIDEEIVPGIDYIREMEDYHNFDSAKVIHIIENNKDIIKEVDIAKDNDGVRIYLKSEENNINCQRFIEGIIDMVDGFFADDVTYYKDDNVIVFGWD